MLQLGKIYSLRKMNSLLNLRELHLISLLKKVQVTAVNFQKTQDIIRKRIPEAILSTPEKFDAVYDGMFAE